MVGSELSKTAQIYLTLRDRIARGEFDRNGGLPGEQALASEFNVSRVTLRRALATLEGEGLIDRRQGAGTFLSDRGRPRPIVVELADMMPHLIAMGRSTEVRLIDFDYRDPVPEVASALRLGKGERVQWSLRRRLIDGAPFSYLTACVPETIGRKFTRRELSRQPLLALLEKNGVIADHATQDISAELATPEAAKALDVAVGAPLIALTRVVRDASGRGVEYLRALYRPDRYTFRMELARKAGTAGIRWAPVLVSTRRMTGTGG
ncbi:MAG: GntR family transcriptional regulator [Xanthobacteraceae bacterium]